MNEIIDWINRNTGKNTVMLIITVFAGIKLINSFTKRKGSVLSIFYKNPKKDESRLNKAIEKYDVLVKEQNNEFALMINSLSKSLEQVDNSIERLQSRSGNDVLCSSSKSRKENVSDQQYEDIIAMSANYPELPAKDDLTLAEIENTMQQRIDHHSKFMEVFSNYLHRRECRIRALNL